MKKNIERLESLLEFVKQISQLKVKPLRNVKNKNIFNKFEIDFYDLPGVSLANKNEAEEFWLKIKRLDTTPPPKLENALLNVWINQSDKPKTLPGLKVAVEKKILESFGYELLEQGSSLEIDSTTISLISLDEFVDKAKLERLLEEYLVKAWKPWAEQEKKVLKNNELFQAFFLLNEEAKIQLDGRPSDLIWGIGIACQQQENGEVLNYPVLTQKIEITHHIEKREIIISCADAPCELEELVFRDLERVNIDLFINYIKDFLSSFDYAINPFDKAMYRPVFTNAVKLIDEDGEYIFALEDESKPLTVSAKDKHFNIYDSWVIFSRPKNNHTLAVDLEGFKNKLTDIDALPPVISALVEDMSDEVKHDELPEYRGLLSSSNNGDKKIPPNELFFPLPYNEAQVQIIQKLAVSNGVVVQGPPGTGKTHTIANIICHYMASGKRVLVTSMKDHALAVLRDKLPTNIRPLAVSLLASEAEGIKQFGFAIDKISNEVQHINPTKSEQEINALLKRIDVLHANIAHADFEIKSLAEKHISTVDIDGQVFTAIDVVKKVRQYSEQLEGFEDKLDVTDPFKPQFSHNEIIQLQEARANVGDAIKYCEIALPKISELPEIEVIQELHSNLLNSHAYQNTINQSNYFDFSKLDDQERNALLKGLLIETQHVNLLCRSEQQKFFFKPIFDYFQDENNKEVFEYFDEVAKQLTEHLTNLKQYIKKPVQLPNHWSEDAEYIEAVSNLATGKKPFGLFGMFGHTQSKQKIKETKLIDQEPNTTEEWLYVNNFIQDQQKLKQLANRWNLLSDTIPFETINPQDKTFASIITWTVEIANVSRLRQRVVDKIYPYLKSTIDATTRELFSEPDGKLEKLEQVLALYNNYYQASSSAHLKNKLVETFSHYPLEVDFGGNNFVKSLGNSSVNEQDILEKWKIILEQINYINKFSSAFETIVSITNKISTSGAPLWATTLKSSPHCYDDTNLIPSNWAGLWIAARMRGYLQRIDCRERLVQLFEARKAQEIELAHVYQRIIETKTWLSIYNNASPKVKAALMAYKNAITHIGKGTGVRANRFRAEARKAAEEANIAVPCWIMSHYKVSESLPNAFGSFDLVIIDEASQSDLTALPAILRAKKILVVGDDKQVSPDGSFINEEKVQQLRRSYLSNQVPLLAAQMSPDRSIYDLFKVAFADSAIMLTEHFRCVTPIIEYSKREFYNHEIKPLRTPLASERLDPPLIDIFIEDGYREDKINPPEARFIVDEIKRISENPKLSKRSIGIVSLIGTDQAKLVMQMINDELGEEIWQNHQIVCGDAYTFQGNEKDIMFVSMVATPKQCQAVTRNSYKQRYNVALSRAKDRMYLVRSVQINDLSAIDNLRLGLLRHFESPFAQDANEIKNGLDACESGFERELYNILTDSGYRVIPQVKVGRYRIDMVVEGDNDKRLAIECDGDRYHGPEQWEHNMLRQRLLERAGWKFWRCFASSFVLNREKVIQNLKEELAKMDIHPLKNTAILPTIYTERRSVRAYEKELTDVNESLDSIVNGDFLEIMKNSLHEVDFDEETYQKAKPHFLALINDFNQAGKNLRDFLRVLIKNFGAEIKPYVLRFIQDYQSENIKNTKFTNTITAQDDPLAETENSKIQPIENNPKVHLEKKSTLSDEKQSSPSVEIGDVVTYLDSTMNGTAFTVKITQSQTSLEEGILNINTPLAQALIGLELGEESNLTIPGKETKELKVIKIVKLA